MYGMKYNMGHSVDTHVAEYDENEKNTYGTEYPFGSLAGTGNIVG
jgi:hypothetical protein